jgi:hypothetical protein
MPLIFSRVVDGEVEESVLSQLLRRVAGGSFTSLLSWARSMLSVRLAPEAPKHALTDDELGELAEYVARDEFVNFCDWNSARDPTAPQDESSGEVKPNYNYRLKLWSTSPHEWERQRQVRGGERRYASNISELALEALDRSSTPVVTCLTASLYVLSRLDGFNEASILVALSNLWSILLEHPVLMHPLVRVRHIDLGRDPVPLAHAIGMSRHARLPMLRDGFDEVALRAFVNDSNVVQGLTHQTIDGPSSGRTAFQVCVAQGHAQIAAMFELQKLATYQFVDVRLVAVHEFVRPLLDAIETGAMVSELVEFTHSHDLLSSRMFRGGSSFGLRVELLNSLLHPKDESVLSLPLAERVAASVSKLRSSGLVASAGATVSLFTGVTTQDLYYLSRLAVGDQCLAVLESLWATLAGDVDARRTAMPFGFFADEAAMNSSSGSWAVASHRFLTEAVMSETIDECRGRDVTSPSSAEKESAIKAPRRRRMGV